MPPAIKVREFLAAKAANAKAGTAEAKSSTPLWKQKLQTRTGITPTTTPVTNKSSTRQLPVEVGGEAEARTADATSTSYAQQQDAKSGEQAATGFGAELKLTLIQAPLLPKPEISRPKPPSDRAALLKQLQSLRSAGAEILSSAEAQPSQQQPTAPTVVPFAPLSSSATPSASEFSFPFSSPYATPSRPTQPQTASANIPSPLQRTLAFGSPGPALTSPSPMTPSMTSLGLASPGPQHQQYGTTAATLRTAEHTAPLSPPALAGLRQQEAHDTGGGFLTHYADPATLATPSPYGTAGAAGGGGRRSSTTRGQLMLATPGGGAGGSSTPLSVLRSIHRVQQLQRLQREGAQLVAAIGEGCSGHERS
ncbi:hypothetical protein Agub_g5458 [Astrephomene gubernaculifera]|uniref:Uncharacterized protein n=1 Tax=Astrephomene gubernaculifera TaxID=47775 RepID=A0AAD3HKS7_9CHLO|nr:hypothetical protein Agub_g5458 [Astrephomene gubernaculifera]